MKRCIFQCTAIIAFAFLLNLNSNAQVAINADGSAPNSASAMLDVKSTDKGILIPRVVSTGSITTPVQGLLIYSTSDDSFYYYDGGQWNRLGSQWNPTGSGIYFSNGVAIGGNPIDPSAILDIQSDALGVLIPRITESAKNSISNPTTSLLIYQTDGTPGYYYYNGVDWSSIAGLTALNVSAPLTTTGGTSPTIGLSLPLTVGQGGTGATTFATNGILYGSGTSPISSNSTFVRHNTTGYIGINSSAPNSWLYVNGSFATALTTKSTSYTPGASDNVILANSSNPITLPTAASITGRVYTIKNIYNGAVTINTTSSQTIDGASSYSLSAQYKYVTVISNGANWFIIANN